MKGVTGGMGRRTEWFTESFLSLCMIVLGLAFIYIPLFDFLGRESARQELSESEKADIRSIRESQGQMALIEAVNRLISRPDVARVQVKLGQYEYPVFEITRGKSERGTDIGRTVYQNETGFWLNIGYTRASVGAPSTRQQLKETIRSLGSVSGGIALIFMALINIFGLTQKSFERHEEERTPTPSSSPPQTSPQEINPRPHQTNVRFGELKLVKKEDDDTERSAS